MSVQQLVLQFPPPNHRNVSLMLPIFFSHMGSVVKNGSSATMPQFCFFKQATFISESLPVLRESFNFSDFQYRATIFSFFNLLRTSKLQCFIRNQLYLERIIFICAVYLDSYDNNQSVRERHNITLFSSLPRSSTKNCKNQFRVKKGQILYRIMP